MPTLNDLPGERPTELENADDFDRYDDEYRPSGFRSMPFRVLAVIVAVALAVPGIAGLLMLFGG